MSSFCMPAGSWARVLRGTLTLALALPFFFGMLLTDHLAKRRVKVATNL
jgi:hypothetical protein